MDFVDIGVEKQEEGELVEVKESNTVKEEEGCISGSDVLKKGGTDEEHAFVEKDELLLGDGDVDSSKNIAYESDESIEYEIPKERNWYDIPPTTTVTRFMKFPALTHPAEFCRGRPWSYELPLFQQMRDLACKKVSCGVKRGVTITNENYFYTSELIKGALLTHNNQRSTLAMLALCYIPEKCAEMLWKVGSSVLSSNPCLDKDKRSFHKWMEKVCKQDHLPEVVMETISAMLSTHGNLQEAYEVATEAVTQDRMANDVYFNIYYGSLEYLMWKVERERVVSSKACEKSRRNWGGDDDEEEEEEEEGEEDESYARNNSLVAFHGRRSIKYLTPVEDEPGIWDLVLPKYIDLLNFYEGRKEAVEALSKHLENNPNNPNSYAFYLHYVDDTMDEGLNRLHVLEDFCALDPTNEWGKELLTRYMKDGSYIECLTLLMNRLDHRDCFNSFFDWHTLHMVLQMRYQVQNIQHFIHNKLSGSSWVPFHFPVPLDKVNRCLDTKVLQLKASIATTLDRSIYAKHVETYTSTQQVSTLTSDDSAMSFHPITVNVSLSSALLHSPIEEDGMTWVSSPEEMLSTDDSDEEHHPVENVLADVIDRVVAEDDEIGVPETSLEEDREEDDVDRRFSNVDQLPEVLHSLYQIPATCGCPVAGRKRQRKKPRKLEDLGSRSPLCAISSSEDEEDTKTTTTIAEGTQPGRSRTDVGRYVVDTYLNKVLSSGVRRRWWSSSSSSTCSDVSSLSAESDEETCPKEEISREPRKVCKNISSLSAERDEGTWAKEVRRKPTNVRKNISSLSANSDEETCSKEEVRRKPEKVHEYADSAEETCPNEKVRQKPAKVCKSIKFQSSDKRTDSSQMTPNENIEPSTYTRTPNTKAKSTTKRSVRKRLSNSPTPVNAVDTPNPNENRKRGRLKDKEPSGPATEPSIKKKKPDTSSSEEKPLSNYFTTPSKEVLKQQNSRTNSSVKKKVLSRKKVNVKRRVKKEEEEEDYAPPRSASRRKGSPPPPPAASERRVTRQRRAREGNV